MMLCNLEWKGGGKHLRKGRKKRIFTIRLSEEVSLLDRSTIFVGDWSGFALSCSSWPRGSTQLLSILLRYRKGDRHEGGRIQSFKSDAEALVALALSFDVKHFN